MTLNRHMLCFVLTRGPDIYSVTLVSTDMSAFKASNPGCVLGDFVRWHSPKDWDEEKRQMSARMAESGNIWQELWEVCLTCLASPCLCLPYPCVSAKAIC